MPKYVDDASVLVAAGHGGPGAVSFRREKYVPRGGPDGGNGGTGGDVILAATRSLQTLMDLKIKGQYTAASGAPGGHKNQSGARGQDLVISVPCGCMVFDENHQLVADLVSPGMSAVMARGGKGGQGNQAFATPTNRAPRHSQPGLPGEEKKLFIELRMVAQVGLVGAPNAGKSTLLQALTAANPKIADYPFTTLYPNLGVLKDAESEIVLADIPGLIEGASEGHGLGIQFLRHIDRTHTLVHLVPAADPVTCWENFQTISAELSRGNVHLQDKKTIVTLSKVDLLPEEDIVAIVRFFADKGVSLLPISSATRVGLQMLSGLLRTSVAS